MRWCRFRRIPLLRTVECKRSDRDALPVVSELDGPAESVTKAHNKVDAIAIYNACRRQLITLARIHWSMANSIYSDDLEDLSSLSKNATIRW